MNPLAKEFLLREGFEPRYGARHLKREIDRHVVYPLAGLLATGQGGTRDVVAIDWDGRAGALTFFKDSDAFTSMAPLRAQPAAEPRNPVPPEVQVSCLQCNASMSSC
jgi:hypothetical protein